MKSNYEVRACESYVCVWGSYESRTAVADLNDVDVFW